MTLENPPGYGLIGRLALEAGILSSDQLSECLHIQGRDANARRLGAILVERGYLRPRQLDALLTRQTDMRRASEAQAPPESPREPITDLALPAVSKALSAPTSSAGCETKLLALLQIAWDNFASDLHIHTSSKPFIRVQGKLMTAHHQALEAEEVLGMLGCFLDRKQLRQLKKKGDVDTAWQLDGNVRLRVNAFMSEGGLGASLRIHQGRVPTLRGLDLPPILARCVTYHQGLVLVAGPAGSGKTSTVAALINLINEERGHNIITVEAPIEFIHPPLRANILQRETGDSVTSHTAALRSALRQDPDVIVVGELRDTETIRMALQAAETGHLVLATVHTRGTVNTLDRLVGAFPVPQQNQARTMIAESLRAIVAQRLLPSTRAKRRTPIVELMFNTPAIANLIREGRHNQIPNQIQLGRKVGMRLLEDSARELLRRGLINEEVLYHAKA